MDTTALVVEFLREDPDATAFLGGRASTVLPADKVFPLARVTRVGGAPALAFTVWLDQALYQLDVWADTPVQAADAARCLVQALAERLPGSRPGGVVTAVRITTVAQDIDPEFEPVKHRVRIGVTVTAHP
ncbi:tail completion protein gp17 [Actinomadura litoris]|uniref:tail completion protein gp17 n=1 Tax=Actinomadura litoris TaxID=2678616 RepID=UPI001FA79B4D|nr:DUF3168 domain-containing protein [Actinomadura litoris]